MIIEKELKINRSIADAWQVLGHEFANADRWATVVKHSKANDSKSLNGSSCSVRGCEIDGMGSIKEKLLQYSNEDHLISYEVFEGAPGMMKKLTNTWQLKPLNGGICSVTMRMELETKGLMGAIMKPMMKMQMSKMGGNTIEEFKYYVENGSPHPRKIKAIKKR